MAPRLVLLLVVSLAAAPAAEQQSAQADDPIRTFIARLEEAGLRGDRDAVLGARTPDAPLEEIADFASLGDPAPEKFIIKERDRAPLEDGSERLLLEVFVQRGREARITTWRMDVTRSRDKGTPPAIAAMERLGVISGLYRLDLSPDKQFDVKNLTVRAPDLTLDVPQGTAFVAEVPDGPTALVLLGRGKMRFSPPSDAERTQLRIFGGQPVLESDFEAAFIRVRPGDLEWRFGRGSLVPRAVSQRDRRRAEDIFDDYVGETLHLDLTDLSRDRWSLIPSSGDLIAEVRTRKHGSLTYTRVGKDAEDISLFERRRRRNISVYASAEKLAARGRFYNEDDLVEYDILHHDIEASFEPDRLWIDGRASLLIRVRSLALTTLTLRLAEPLTVRSIVSPTLGRLLHLRVVGQNSIIVNFPATVPQNTEVWLQVIYGGRVEPQTLEREAIALQSQQQEPQEQIQIRLEPQWVYSNRSYWHPQGTVSDYATGRLRLIVPPEYDVVASGTPVGPPAPAPGPVQQGQRPRKMFVFDSARPARYFGCVISRFSQVSTQRLTVPSPAPAPRSFNGGDAFVSLVVQANPRQTGRARSIAERTIEILEYYASLFGDAPYPSFTLAVAEGELPGGHSPPYFAVLNQTLPMAAMVWRNDPVSFDGYPSFFLAHELAHQWWGQAVGWKNYHEQWISEGFAQYFATLYAARERGDGVLNDVIRQMRRWAIDQSSQGPVYLGYRLGHIKGDGRVFRAIIYNKGAMVLHMLRRLLGDDAFFEGVRRFYQEWRFRKAGTNDFRVLMEAVGGRDLEAFFEHWIYGTGIPELRFSYELGPSGVLLRFEHRRDVIPVPVTVTIEYADGSTEELVVPVLERTVQHVVPTRGRVRNVDVNQDNGSLAEFAR